MKPPLSKIRVLPILEGHWVLMGLPDLAGLGSLAGLAGLTGLASVIYDVVPLFESSC